MELRIKELLQEQGLRMSDLADRMGTNQSNLAKSLAANPKLSTLQEVAAALKVQMHELFTGNIPTTPKGVVSIGGRTYGLVENRSIVQVPSYTDYSLLRRDVRNFIKNRVRIREEGRTNAFCAFVGGYELMSLVYDRANARFILTLYYEDMESETFFFDKMEYAEWKEGDDREPTWNIEQMTWDIIGDIENVVPFKLGDYTTPADLEEERSKDKSLK